MKEMMKFIDESVTAFNATNNLKKELLKNKYEELDEKKEYKILKGHKYFVTRNSTSIIAFNVGKKLDDPSLQIAASHSDCPTFKIKPQAFIFDNNYLRLNTEVYGGAIYYPWLDRALSIAGRVIVKTNKSLKTIIYKDEEPFCVIPSVAIHQNRDVNKGIELNPQIDLLPLVSLEKGDMNDFLAKQLKVKKEDIKGFDLYLYPMDKAFNWGLKKEFISSFHIDNLECAYTSFKAFLNNFNDNNINVYCCFDNEEVGSLTRQGADSDFLQSTLNRVCKALKLDYYSLVSSGMLLSCDNGHALHPNHPEKADPVNRPLINKGVVIKYNANQSYTSDGLTSAIFKNLLDSKKIPYQYFANRSDSKGGSTLGNLSNGHVSILSIDIGLAQLAMHSPMETAGVKDIEYMIQAIKEFYKAHLSINGDIYNLK